MKAILAEIITIGDEILYGQILDTNSKWISEELDNIGVKVVQKTTIGDVEEDILEALSNARKRANLILITGGLGPTNDDLTKPCLAKFFNVGMEINKKAEEEVRHMFESRGRELTETNRMQALLPTNCTMISNDLGTAPGMWFDEDSTVYISMPGVPFEMKGMMTNSLLPKIQERFQTPVIYHRVIKTIGIGESFLADKIKSWEDNLPKHIKLAYLPSIVEVKLRLTAIGDSMDHLKQDVKKEEEKLKSLIGKYIYGFNSDSLQLKVGEYLKKLGKTISTAESCTGGYLAHLITSIPGSSDYFRGSIIAYDDDIKIHNLDVNPGTLDKYGAVSEETVIEMAEQVRSKLNTDVGVSVSGIAGPDGGTTDKPVGTVWIAVADDSGTLTKKLNLIKNRELNIQASAKLALNFVRQRLIQND